MNPVKKAAKLFLTRKRIMKEYARLNRMNLLQEIKRIEDYISVENRKVPLYDIPRTKEQAADLQRDLAEEIKNSMIVSQRTTDGNVL